MERLQSQYSDSDEESLDGGKDIDLGLSFDIDSLHLLYANLDSDEATHSDMSVEVKKSSDKLSEDTHDESTEKGSTSETADEKGNQQNSSSEGIYVMM